MNSGTTAPDTCAPAKGPPRLGLAFGKLVWRVTALLSVLLELGLWWIMRAHRPRLRRTRRLLILLLNTPNIVCVSFLVGSLVAIVAGLVVRFVLQPLVWSWYHPSDGVEFGSFHFAPNEVIANTSPARRAWGTRWQPGVLVRTNLRLWFFPLSWDSEPWSSPLAELPALDPEPPPPLAWGLVTGLPYRLRYRGAAGTSELFAVPDPHEVMAWLELPKTLLNR